MSFRSAYNSAFWKRLRKNKGALFGIVVICFAVFTALFCYIIAPDNSPDANRMIPEISDQKAGFDIQFLLLKKRTPPKSKAF